VIPVPIVDHGRLPEHLHESLVKLSEVVITLIATNIMGTGGVEMIAATQGTGPSHLGLLSIPRHQGDNIGHRVSDLHAVEEEPAPTKIPRQSALNLI
jgi:hypothetical protein